MPNYCNNRLTIEGDASALADFKKRNFAKNDPNYDGLCFTMQELYPTPNELLEMTSPVMWRGDEADEDGKKEFEKHVEGLLEKYGHTDWYNWRVRNWGCKWDASESCIVEDSENVLSVEYDTAWAPNTGWVNFAAKVYPSLKFTLSFEEPGMAFCGVYTAQGDDDDLVEGDLQWVDEYGALVEWDSDKERWYVVGTNEIIDDEDFYPSEHNPFI